MSDEHPPAVVTVNPLRAENERLRERLAEAERILRAWLWADYEGTVPAETRAFLIGSPETP